jgi:hypothetical protein
MLQIFSQSHTQKPKRRCKMCRMTLEGAPGVLQCDIVNKKSALGMRMAGRYSFDRHLKQYLVHACAPDSSSIHYSVQAYQCCT